MVNAHFYLEDGAYFRADVSGHAGCGARGEDLVCAGISALVQAALNGLDCFTAGRFGWQTDPDGSATMVLDRNLDAESQKCAHVVLKTLELGLSALAESYPEALRVHIKEVAKDDSY